MYIVGGEEIRPAGGSNNTRKYTPREQDEKRIRENLEELGFISQCNENNIYQSTSTNGRVQLSREDLMLDGKGDVQIEYVGSEEYFSELKKKLPEKEEPMKDL
jgi:hypothetical protein